eukprot:gene27305-32981_t
MRIQECSKPKSQTQFQFASDKPLSKAMCKVELYNRLLNRFCTTLVVGKQGSGKSSLIMNLLNDRHGYKGRFDKIFVFLPGTSMANVRGSPYEKLDPSQIYEELNHESLSEVYEMVKEIAEGNEDAQRKQRCLLVFDDVSSQFKDGPLQLLMKRIVKNQRHLFVSSIFVMQTFFDMPKQLRQLCNNLFLFKMSKAVMHSIVDELLEVKKEKVDELIRFVYDGPHAWMAVNMNSGEVYKQYDRVIMDDEDEV